MSDYRLGTIWSINFEPQVGTEIKKTRPGVIISGTSFNLQRQKITVLPLTSGKIPSQGMARVFVAKSKLNQLTQNSEIIVVDPATFDKRRFNRFIGELEANLLVEVQDKLKIYLSL